MLGFECDCSVDVNEAARAESHVIRRARKRHTCGECSRIISPGERYEVYSGIDYDGAPFSDKTCLGCMRIRDRFCPGGWYRGGVAELVEQCLGFDYRDDPNEWDADEVEEEDAENRRLVLEGKGRYRHA